MSYGAACNDSSDGTEGPQTAKPAVCATSFTHGYDRYGNMTCVTNGQTNGPCPAVTFNAGTNRLATIAGTTMLAGWYDAAGNMLTDGTGTGSHTYSWDAEGRLTSVASPSGGSLIATYTYNALGQRVEKAGTCQPWIMATCEEVYDAFGNLAMLTRTTGGGLVAYVPPVAGRQFAEYSNGYTWFSHPSAVGSVGSVTNQTGTLLQGEIYYPWGQRWATSGSLYWERFASMPKVRDTETGLDPTANRMLTSQYGRWLSPDPLAGNILNPQSLNRYAYAGNNPTSLIDPSGLDPCDKDPGGRRCSGFNDAVGSGTDGSCYVDGMATNCGVVFSMLNSGIAVQCPNNFCSGFAPVGNGQIAFVQFASYAGLGGSAYNLLTQPIPDPALPINEINAAYQLGCQYATNPCGDNNSASVRYVGLTYNVTLNGNPLNKTVAAQAGYLDPIGFWHNGDTSYYIGFGGLFGINEGHVVDATATYGGLEAHYDSWGPLNPFHWMEAVLSLFINTRNQAGAGTLYTCSVVGGCHP